MAFDPEGFAARLNEMRVKRGMTQETLAERSGLSAHYIGNLEQQVRRPSLNTLLILCAALGTTPDSLIRDSLSEDMVQGRCASVPDDYALRENLAELAWALRDWLEPDDYALYDEQLQCTELIDEDPHPFISLSDLFLDEKRSSE